MILVRRISLFSIRVKGILRLCINLIEEEKNLCYDAPIRS